MSLFHWTNLESQVLSKIQRDICDMKSLGSTKAEISARFNISDHAIYAAIRATMNGNHWEPNMSKGGGIQYIGEVRSNVDYLHSIQTKLDQMNY